MSKVHQSSQMENRAAEASPSQNAEPKASRIRVEKACNACRLRRCKCDGKEPCSSCILRNVTCKFQEHGDHRKRKRRISSSSDPVNDIERLQQQQKQLVDVLRKMHYQLRSLQISRADMTRATSYLPDVMQDFSPRPGGSHRHFSTGNSTQEHNLWQNLNASYPNLWNSASSYPESLDNISELLTPRPFGQVRPTSSIENCQGQNENSTARACLPAFQAPSSDAPNLPMNGPGDASMLTEGDPHACRFAHLVCQANTHSFDAPFSPNFHSTAGIIPDATTEADNASLSWNTVDTEINNELDDILYNLGLGNT